MRSGSIFIVVCLLSVIWASKPYSFSRSALEIPDEDHPARLLVTKKLLNKIIVENMDLVVKYSVFNVGDEAANDVQLRDSTFNPDFEIVSGQVEVNFGRIPPQNNVTHTLVVRPINVGYYNFTAAQISYISGDESQEVIQGWSTEPGEGYISSFRDYDRKVSRYPMEWAAFAIMSVFTIFIPFLLWRSNNTKYEAFLLLKKKK